MIFDGSFSNGKRFCQTNVSDTSQYGTQDLYHINRKLAHEISNHILSDPKFYKTERYPDMIATRLDCIVFTKDEYESLMVEQYNRGKRAGSMPPCGF